MNKRIWIIKIKMHIFENWDLERSSSSICKRKPSSSVIRKQILYLLFSLRSKRKNPFGFWRKHPQQLIKK